MSLKTFIKLCNQYSESIPSFRESFRESEYNKCSVCGSHYTLKSTEEYYDIYLCSNAKCNNQKRIWDRI